MRNNLLISIFVKFLRAGRKILGAQVPQLPPDAALRTRNCMSGAPTGMVINNGR